ncbi:COG4223 family protein [Pseudahrensia aquimaris]|uniref:COG4223 family protein n=1 Tax=Pseudahrensia aquimaris TaxID=744461 RepID=A0ABW3FE13_9HYPH
MSKSPKRPASRRTPKKPVTIDLEADSKKAANKAAKSAPVADAKKADETKAETVKAQNAEETSRRSTPRVGRDAGKEPKADLAAENKKEAAPEKPTVDAPKAAEQADKKPAAPAKPTAPPTPEKSGGGTGGRIAAGVVGGLLALGGGAGLQAAGYLPNFGAVETQTFVTPDELQKTSADLVAQIANLQTQLEEVSSAPVVADPDQLAAAIDARLEQGVNPVDPGVAGKLLDAENRIISLETYVSEAQAKLAELSSAVASASAGDSAVDGSALAAVTEKLDGLANDVSQLKQAPQQESVDPATVVALGTTVATIQSQIGALETSLGAVSAKTDKLPDSFVTPEAVDEKLAGLKSGLDDSLSAIESKVGELSGAVESQQAALGTVQEQVSNGADKRAAVALIAAQLKSQVDRGEPFAQTLETLKTASGEGESYVALEPFASSGVATVDELATRFGTVSEDIINATTDKSAMSLTDRLLSGAKSLVKVKPIDGVEGDTPDAIVSRIDSALRKGDAVLAAEAWQALPDAGKAASQSWFDALQARITADNLLSATVQNFISSTVSN